MVIREKFLNQIAELFETFPIVAVIGARQIGKFTLARAYAKAASKKNKGIIF